MSHVLKNTDAPVSAVSSGGTVAVLAGAGKHSACQLAGIDSFSLYYGVSGGAIFNAMRALGRSPKDCLHMAIFEDFSSHVSIRGGILGSFSEFKELVGAAKRLARISAAPAEERADLIGDETWLGTGILGTKGLGEFIKKNARETGLGESWPETYCTMATLKNGSQVVFNKDGVFLVDLKDKKVQLSSKPVPLAMAVRYSATIPGIMVALEYEDHLLFDGALSRDGLCPVGVLIRHFDVQPEKIIACRVGEDATHFIFGPAQRAVRRIWMVHPDYHWGAETAGVVEFRPPIDHIHSLKFNLSRDEKWLAILISFESCLKSLAFNGYLSGERLQEAQSLFKSIGYWRDMLPAPSGSPQLLADRAERVFAEHGLF